MKMEQQFNISHKALVACYDKLVSELAQDPKKMAIVFFQHRIIREDTLQRINELDKTKRDKATLLVDDLLNKVKAFPDYYDKFINILSEDEAQHEDLLQLLKRTKEDAEARKSIADLLGPINTSDGNRFSCETNILSSLSDPLGLPSPPLLAIPTFEHLPTADDRGTLSNPLTIPPDENLVGNDIKEAASNRHGTPSGDTFEGKLLRAFQASNYKLVKQMLQEPECKSNDLRLFCDSDGKTLLHLACRKEWPNWRDIIKALVENHHCNVSAVDEDGNTLLHDAYQCGNRSTMTYLLSLPACSPDVPNNHKYTVLRMALESEDKPAVRELLTTGRVDPRCGSLQGHTYSELLGMNQLKPKVYEGSALQMVELFAKLIETSPYKHVQFTSFTSWCLLDVVSKGSKTITVTGIQELVKDNLLPLPESPQEIHKLLLVTQSECPPDIYNLTAVIQSFNDTPFQADPFTQFVEDRLSLESQDFTAQSANDADSPKIVSLPHQTENEPSITVYDPSQARDLNSPLTTGNQSNTRATADDPELDIEMTPFLRHTGETSPNVFQNELYDDTSEPPHYDDTTEELSPLLPQNESVSTAVGTQIHKKKNKFTELFWGWFCLFYSCFCLLGVLLLGVLGTILYDNRTLSASVNVSLIRRPSTPFIGVVPSNEYMVTFQETDLLPITLHALSSCTQPKFNISPIIETQTVIFGSPETYAKEVTEWYFLHGSTLTISIDIESIVKLSSCDVQFLVFDNYYQLTLLVTQQNFSESYYKSCVNNKTSPFQLNFESDSYYYFSVYTGKPNNVRTVTLHFNGVQVRYDLSNTEEVCSIVITANENSCDAELAPFKLVSTEICFVGDIPQSIATQGLRETTISVYTAPESDTNVNVYFFIPFMVVFSLCALLVCCIICAQRADCKN